MPFCSPCHGCQGDTQGPGILPASSAPAASLALSRASLIGCVSSGPGPSRAFIFLRLRARGKGGRGGKKRERGEVGRRALVQPSLRSGSIASIQSHKGASGGADPRGCWSSGGQGQVVSHSNPGGLGQAVKVYQTRVLDTQLPLLL